MLANPAIHDEQARNPGGTQNQRSRGSCSSWNAVLNPRLGVMAVERAPLARFQIANRPNSSSNSSGIRAKPLF